MQITTDTSGDLLEMHITGRLDNESAEYFNATVDDVIRQGRHSVVVHMTEVRYVSSAGLGALVRAHKQFQTIRGFFGVASASPAAAEVIRLTGLAKMLMCEIGAMRKSPALSQTTVMPNFRIGAAAGIQLEVYDLHPDARFACRAFGDPSQIDRGFSGNDCRVVPFPIESLGLGLGAFGSDFLQAAPRFGEFLAVAGSAAQQPTAGSDKPDYQLATGDFVPSAQMLYGLTCSGTPSLMIRFEPDAPQQRIRLSDLVDQCLQQLNAPRAVLVFVSEAAGLVGARLRRSPALADQSSAARLSHPEIRRWLSFTPERAFPHTLALVVGVASRGAPAADSPTLAAMLRPLRPDGDIRGHFHAAVFSYRPFKKRRLDLRETVTSLFENEDLQAVIHLLHDDREISGGGETEIASGACWMGPLDVVMREEAA